MNRVVLVHLNLTVEADDDEEALATVHDFLAARNVTEDEIALIEVIG